MAQSAQFFKDIFAAAAVAISEGSKNREYVVLYKSVMDCIRKGESEAAYVQNQLGYNSETLLTKIVNGKKSTKDKTEYFTKAELFGLAWNKAMSDVRKNVANATIAKVWGISIEGMRGIAGYVGPYCSAIERQSDDVVFVPAGKDAKVLSTILKPTKTSKTGVSTYTMSIKDFLTTILDKKLPLEDAKLTAEKKPTPQISGRHAEFADVYRSKLGKYTQFRTQRLSVALEGIDDDYEW